MLKTHRGRKPRLTRSPHRPIRDAHGRPMRRGAISERGVPEAGLNFLSKPFTGTALLTKVRAVLDAK